jgi:four helix bundle protein
LLASNCCGVALRLLLIIAPSVARSKAEFIARLGVVAKEADESVFWLEMIEETKMLNPKLLEEILKEARELAAIFSASLRTAKSNR